MTTEEMTMNDPYAKPNPMPYPSSVFNPVPSTAVGPAAPIPDEDLDAPAALRSAASLNSADTASTASAAGTPRSATAAAVVDAMPTAETVQRAAQVAHDTVDRVAERAAPMVEEVRRKASDAGERLMARRDQLNDWRVEWTAQCRSSVREHPMAAVGLAALFGLLVGRLSSR